jgi:hypothetical protein
MWTCPLILQPRNDSPCISNSWKKAHNLLASPYSRMDSPDSPDETVPSSVTARRREANWYLHYYPVWTPLILVQMISHPSTTVVGSLKICLI